MKELLIAQKVEEMIKYGYVAVRQFPKSERHVLSQELRLSMWRLLRLVIICSKRYHKKTTLQELDAELELLRLRLNNKTQVFPVGQRHGRGLDFLGYRMWTTHRRLRRDSVKRMKRRLKGLEKAYSEGLIDFPEIRQRLASWVGHAAHADSYRIRAKVLGEAVFKRENGKSQ